MAKTLQLNFNLENGKNVTMIVDELREDLTAPEMEAAMQAIIASGVFELDDYKLESIRSAQM